MTEVRQLPKGSIYVNCKSKVIDPLLEECFTFIAVAGDTTDTGEYTTTTGRGLIQAMRIVVATSSVEDAGLLTLTVSVNDMEMVKRMNGTEYMVQNLNSRSYKNIVIPEKAIITATAVNAAGSDIPVSVVFYYYDPYQKIEFQQ